MAETRVEEYRVLLEGGEGEIVEKKSRFLATVRKCESEAEVAAFIGEMKKKYWDARHNCSACVIGSRGELTRCSDDGEPGGTAGRPMLEVLLGDGVRNAAVVVTRYFGGVLLGTGGLVRAYTQAVKEGLAHCTFGVMRYGRELEAAVDYNDVGRILHLLGQRGIEPTDSLYAEAVTLRLLVPAGSAAALERELLDAAGGRVRFTELGERYYIDKERRKS